MADGLIPLLPTTMGNLGCDLPFLHGVKTKNLLMDNGGENVKGIVYVRVMHKSVQEHRISITQNHKKECPGLRESRIRLSMTNLFKFLFIYNLWCCSAVVQDVISMITNMFHGLTPFFRFPLTRSLSFSEPSTLGSRSPEVRTFWG